MHFSEIRQNNSKTLIDKIIEGLKDLNFLDVQFRIDFKRKEEYTAGGFDDIEYEISTNPGESVKPLGRIVSGGSFPGSCWRSRRSLQTETRSRH